MNRDPDGSLPPLPSLFAVGLIAGSALASQVLLTRILSALMAYHFSYLAVSLSLVGTGAGAMLVYLRPDRFRAETQEVLGRWSLWFALGLIVAPVAIARLDLVGRSPSTWEIHFALACCLAALPPFAAGVVIALALARYRTRIGSVYAADLGGAGIGAMLSVPLMWLLPAPDLMVGLGAVAAGAAALFATRRWGRWAALAGASSIAVLSLAKWTPLLFLDTGYVTPPGGFYVERWNPLARVIGSHDPASDDFAMVLYDRVLAPVPITANGRHLTWRNIQTGVQSIGYELTGPGRALIIGGGGGRDIHTALFQGQKPVDVIELNRGIRDIVDVDLGFVSGSPYSLPGVHTVIGDGRSALAARDTAYDQIHLGFTDTLSANAAQGFALMENNLYTVEAFHEYFAHLEPRGVLNVSRLYRFVGHELLRLSVLTQAALRSYGIAEPRQHMIVMRGQQLGIEMGTVLARLEPFEQHEIELLRTVASARGATIVYEPGRSSDEWRELAEASDLRGFCENYPLDVCPPTDDKPFFFNMERVWTEAPSLDKFFGQTSPTAVLVLTMMVLSGLSLLAFGLPMILTRESAPPFTSLLYFACIGLGYILVELVLIQHFVLFLGFPTYALSVVLAGLLLSSGLGARLSEEVATERGLEQVLGVAVVVIAVGAFGLQPLLRSLISLPLAGRVAIALFVLLPIGGLLGFAMPLGLRRLERQCEGGIPYAWGINGVASVLASVVGALTALSFGFTVAGIVAALCYVAAAGLAPRMRPD